MNYTEIVNLKKHLDDVRIAYLPHQIGKDVESLRKQCDILLRPILENTKRELHNSESLQMKWVVVRAASRFMYNQIGKTPDHLTINRKPPYYAKMDYSTYRYGIPNYWEIKSVKNNGKDWIYGWADRGNVKNKVLRNEWKYISSVVVFYDYIFSKYELFLNSISDELFNLILAAAKNYNNKNTPSYELFESMLIEEFLGQFPNSLSLFTKLFNEYIE